MPPPADIGMMVPEGNTVSKLWLSELDLQDGGPEAREHVIASLVRRELPEPVARARPTGTSS